MLGSLFKNVYIRRYIQKIYYTYIKLEESYISGLLSPDRVVLSGIFEGMQYPAYEASGSSIFTKFLGSYEDELHPVLMELLHRNYTTLIDVGCAEGYYAVGLAKISPKLSVYAYDIDEVARKSCNAMAKINGVSDRVHIRDLCTKETLQNFAYDGKTLIICDCEGYEAVLFDSDTAQSLKGHDLIIELHDNVVPNIKDLMVQVFRNTHDIRFVPSKLKSTKDYPLMLKLPDEYIQDRYLIERGTRMEWAVLTSKG